MHAGVRLRNAALVALAAIGFVCAAHARSGSSFTGRVVGVSDGDTIKVLRHGRAQKVRLHGVDSPEKHQAFGQRAKQFTSGLVFQKEVTVTVLDRDRYGRLVADVSLPDGRSLNRELLTAGMAWWYRRYSNDPTLGELEREARSAKRGLWADPNPTPPWQFRDARRSGR